MLQMNKNCDNKMTCEKPPSTEHMLAELRSRLNHLYTLLTNPQIIHLRDFEHLQLKSVSHDIKQRVQTLFFEANIPINWISQVKWTHPSATKIDVHITLLNYIVKEKVKEMLLDYFKNQYNNTIYID
jgi:hypothetical protein